MSRNILVALDQGTTSSRAIVFDEAGRILAAHAIEFKQHYPQPGWVEHDPEDILNTQITALQKAVELSGVEVQDIAAIGITNQRETTLLWEKDTGRCVHNAIVWQCRRTAPYVERLVREGKADIPMKGILQTSNFARAILNKETGLIPKGGRRLVSQCGIFEYEGRFIMITDAAINIAPDVETQIGIVENALPVARALGVECPKVAVLSAVENVTDKMPSTVTAREIAERGVEGCVISGPLALDGAISMESVKHKAIKDPVAGQADILLVPFIEIGNVLYKACSYIAGKTMASTICGASCPVIITSRADTPDSKYYSILMAVLRCLKA